MYSNTTTTPIINSTILYDENVSIFNTSNQISNNIKNLDNNYKENNGLLIKIFNYNSSTNNNYIFLFTKYLELIIELLGLPNIVKINNINILSNNNNDYKYILQKSNFNNIPILTQFIETFENLDIKYIDNFFNNSIQKNTQGNYPSLIIITKIEQINLIIKNNIFIKFYENKIPIYIMYGLATPEIIYYKYLYDNELAIDNPRTTKSYILNVGPCNTLDELSAYIEFIKLEELRKKFNNDPKKFNTYTSIIKNGTYYGGPKLDSPNYQNNRYLLNYNPYSLDYKIDISNKTIFYIGTNSNYGFNHPQKFFEKITQNLYSIIINEYDSSSNPHESIIRASNSEISDVSYNTYLQNIITNNINNITNSNYSNISNVNNPKIIMLKIPKYQTQEEEEDLNENNGVKDCWKIVNYYINYHSLNIDDVYIYLRSYSSNSDLISLKYLFNNQHLIARTTGSYYDFLEENFKDPTFNNNTFSFAGLKKLSPYNAHSFIAYENYINKFEENVEKIKSKLNITELSNEFDQFKFYEILANANILSLLVNNIQLNKGLINNQEDLEITQKIYSGEEFFDTNYIFDYSKIATTNAASLNGYSETNKLLFGDIISSSYNNNNYWDISNGYPFNRNTSYVLLQRANNNTLQNNHNYNLVYRNVETITNELLDGTSFFISSEKDLINSIIFEINNDASANDYYNYYLSLYKKDTLLYDFSENIYNLNHYNRNITINENIILDYFLSKTNNNFKKENIKKIEFGNFVSIIEGSFNSFPNLQEIYISKNIVSLKSSCFKDLSNLQIINFENDSALITIEDNVFNNCKNLNSIILPSSLININNNAFSNCISLNNIILGSNINSLSIELFKNCTNLQSINITKNIVTINNSAFENCSSLNSVIFDPSSTLTHIKDRAFSDCTSLSNIIIPNSVTTIGSFVFFNNTSLTNIHLNSNLQSLNNNSFSNCISLNNINLENTSITDLSDNLFINCINLSYIITPFKLKRFGFNIFENCNNFNKLYILSDSLENINDSNNILNNITNTVNIYYFSNKTQTSNIQKITNNPLPNYIDLYNNPEPTLTPIFNFNYSDHFNLKLNNKFIEPGYNFYYLMESYNYILPYNIDISTNLDITIENNYTINYKINTLNNIIYDFSRSINVINNNAFPNIELLGTKTQYIFLNNNYLEFGYKGYDVTNNELIVYKDDAQFNNSIEDTYNINYYTFDTSYNYVSTMRTIYMQENTLLNARSNLLINYEKSFFDFSSNPLHPTLYITFENNSNSIEQGLALNINNIKKKYSVFPIFNVSSNISDSNNLTVYPVYGPPLNQSFFANSYQRNNENFDTNYYFIQRMSPQLFNNSSIHLINGGLNTYTLTKITSNYLIPSLTSAYYAYNPPLYANNYINLKIEFSVHDFSQNLNKIFALFLDNATEGYENELISSYGNTSEVPSVKETYDVSNDNTFLFKTPLKIGPIIELVGKKNITLELNQEFIEPDPPIELIYYDISNNYPSISILNYQNNIDTTALINRTFTYDIYYTFNNIDFSIVTLNKYINVIQNNNNKPTITINNNINNNNNIEDISQNSIYNDPGAQAFDICNNPLKLYTYYSNTPISSTLGTQYIKYYTFDENGNYEIATRTLNII
jgi:hypothetical protein